MPFHRNLWYCFRSSGFSHFKHLYMLIIHAVQLSVAFGFSFTIIHFTTILSAIKYVCGDNVYGYRVFSQAFLSKIYSLTHLFDTSMLTDLISAKNSIPNRTLDQSWNFNSHRISTQIQYFYIDNISDQQRFSFDWIDLNVLKSHLKVNFVHSIEYINVARPFLTNVPFDKIFTIHKE